MYLQCDHQRDQVVGCGHGFVLFPLAYGLCLTGYTEQSKPVHDIRLSQMGTLPGVSQALADHVLFTRLLCVEVPLGTKGS